MALEVRVSGSAKLHAVAASIRATGDKGLGRQMSAALQRATRPLSDAIARSAGAHMPARGGYAGVLARSLRTRFESKTGPRNARIVLRTYADGTGERRDVPALEKGILRHPVYGRSRKIKRKGKSKDGKIRHPGNMIANPWAVTKIRSGFHKSATDNAADQVQQEMITVLDDLAQRLANG